MYSNDLREYLVESQYQQYEHKNDVRETLDQMLSEGYSILDNRSFYMKQFNHLTRQLLENAVPKEYGVLDFQFETINLVTQGIADKANTKMQEIRKYVESLELPSEKAAYSNWFRELNPDYVPEVPEGKKNNLNEANTRQPTSVKSNIFNQSSDNKRFLDEPNYKATAKMAALRNLERRIQALVNALQSEGDSSRIDSELADLQRDLEAVARSED